MLKEYEHHGSFEKAYANMKALVAAETPVITVVGKSWDFHVTEALRTTLDENLKAIRETVEFLKKSRENDQWQEHSIRALTE